MENNTKHIVSFSGGKDSTAMLLLMIEKGYHIDEILFLDTGVEFPQMYKHIKKVEKYIKKPITILKAEHSFEYMMFDYVKKKGKNKGQKGYSWTDFRNRWCTKYFKQHLMKVYLRNKYGKKSNIIQYVGLACDEMKRVNRKNRDVLYKLNYPLVELGITENMALDYCYKKGFNWDGLYDKFKRVSCWCCPLQSIGDLRTLYNNFPNLWCTLKEWDNKTYRKFRADYSVEELEAKFEKEKLQIPKKSKI